MNKTLGGLEQYLNQVNCIMDSRVDFNIHTKGFKKIFYSFCDTDFIMTKLAKYNNFITFNESGGTATTLAFTSAVKMGFSKIITVGIDLAFKDNEIYYTLNNNKYTLPVTVSNGDKVTKY